VTNQPGTGTAQMKSSRLATPFIAMIAVSGFAMLAGSALKPNALHYYQFLSLLIISAVASRMKVKLPGVDGNMSVNLPFMLIAAAQLSLFEAVAVALVSAGVQCIPKKSGGKLQPVKMLFSVSTIVLAAGAAAMLLHNHWLVTATNRSASLPLVAAASMFFLVNTLPVATIISLTEGSHLLRIWSSILHLSFPYYVACTGVTSIITAMSQLIGWQVPLTILPVMLLMYRCYQVYFGHTAETPTWCANARAAGA
jgi:hypothetical protein